MFRAVSGKAKQANATNVEQLIASYGRISGVRSNLVVDSNGSFVDSKGSSRALQTPADRELLVGLRRLSYIVVVDAATARIEKYRAMPARPLAILSKSGSFEGIPAVEDPVGEVLLVSQHPREIPNNPKLITLVSESDKPFDRLLSWATERSLTSILLETGPTLTKAAISHGLVKEAALTISRVNEKQADLVSHPLMSSAKLVSHASDDLADFTLWA